MEPRAFLQFLTVDIDTIRLVLITGLAVAFVFYARFRLITGGTLTPIYVLLLVLEYRWLALIVTIVVAFTTWVIVRRLIVRIVPLTKAWIAGSMIFVGAALNSLLYVVSESVMGSGVWGLTQPVLIVGLYVTPGLIAYDWERQGVVRTMGAALAVAGITFLLSIPVLWLATNLVQGTSQVVIEGVGRIPESLWWFATLVTVVATLVLRLSWGLRAGGFLGALFIFNALTPVTAFLALAFATATWLIVRLISALSLLTPRQRFQMSLLIGSGLSWFGLYWFTAFNYEPAIIANGYALEPLLAVGLLASDFGRRESSVVRTIAGTFIVVGVVAVAMWVVQESPALTVAVVIVTLVGGGLMIVPGARVARKQREQALAAGIDMSPALQRELNQRGTQLR